MARIVEEKEQPGIRAVQETVDLLGGLHPGPHVMVIGEDHALFPCALAEPVQTVGKTLPFLVGKARLGVQHGNVLLSLDRFSLLGRADDVRPDGMQEIPMLNERLFHFRIGLGREEGAEPGVADLEPPQVQRTLDIAGSRGYLLPTSLPS